MSYQSVVEMAGSTSLMQRLVAAAAGEGQEEPLAWVQRNIWKLASSPGWADSWDYAKQTDTPDNNPDTGARPGVISDAAILASVQSLRSAEQTPEPTP